MPHQMIVKTVAQLQDEAEIAADYLEGLLDILNFDGDIELSIRDNRPMLQIIAEDSEDLPILIGHHGSVLSALQSLTRLAVQQRTGERSYVVVDINGYLQHRRNNVKKLAFEAIDECRESGEPVSLRYMNAYDRKLVHSIVHKEGLRSRSYGSEPRRYVTVMLPKPVVDEDFEDDFEDTRPDEYYDAPNDVQEYGYYVDIAAVESQSADEFVDGAEATDEEYFESDFDQEVVADEETDDAEEN